MEVIVLVVVSILMPTSQSEAVGEAGLGWWGEGWDSGGGSCCSSPVGGLALNLAISYLSIQPFW